MRRVLLVFEPPDGGVAVNVSQLAGGLPGMGWEVALAGPTESAVYAALAPGTLVRRVPLVREYTRPALDAVAGRELGRVLRGRDFDIVHLHSAKAGAIGRAVGRVSRAPVVYSPHCFPFVGEFSRARKLFATILERGLAPLTDATICVCEDERRQALAVGLAPSRLHVVLNGCAAPEQVEADERLLAMRERGPLATAIAAMRPQKSLDVFIDAAPLVWRQLPQAQLAIVGEGPQSVALRAQAEALGVAGDERFAFIDFTPPAARYLTATDLYVLPSSWEALPIGVLEALSCGVPQVATAVGGTPEAVSPESGLLVPRNDPAALAHAIVELLPNPARRAAMSAASIARWEREFRVEQMVARTARVYDEVLKSHRQNAISPVT